MMPAKFSAPAWLAQYRALFDGQDQALESSWQQLIAQPSLPFSLDKQLQQAAQAYRRLFYALSSVQIANNPVQQLQQQIRTALRRGDLARGEALNQQFVAQILQGATPLPAWRRHRWLRHLAQCQAYFALLHLSLGHYRSATIYLISALEALPEINEYKELRSLYQNEAGYALYLAGNYTYAERFYAKALRLSQQEHGELHLDVAVGLNNLALLKAAQTEREAAETLLLRVLDIKHWLCGEHHKEYAAVCHNLAALYAAWARLADAKPLLLRAVAIRTQVLGAQHPDTQLSQHNLAWLHTQQAEYEPAEALYLSIVQQRQQHLGMQHPDTALAALRLAHWYQAQARPQQAQPLYRQAQSALHAIVQDTQVATPALQVYLQQVAPAPRTWRFWTRRNPLNS